MICSQVSFVVSSVQQKKARNLIQFPDMNRRKTYTAYVVLLMPSPSQKSLLPLSLASPNEPLSRWSNISALPDLQSSKKILIFLPTVHSPPPSPYNSLHQLLTLLFHKKFVGTHLSSCVFQPTRALLSQGCTCPSAAQFTAAVIFSYHLSTSLADVDFPVLLPTRDSLDRKIKATD